MRSATFNVTIDFDKQNLPKLTEKNIRKLERQLKEAIRDYRFEYETLDNEDIPDYPDKITVGLRHHD